MINDKLEIANFELRNWEPARRVGVRRTISNLKKHRAESEESGARTQNSGFSVQGGWRFQVSVFPAAASLQTGSSTGFSFYVSFS
jgi:hypothetical protein